MKITELMDQLQDDTVKFCHDKQSLEFVDSERIKQMTKTKIESCAMEKQKRCIGLNRKYKIAIVVVCTVIALSTVTYSIGRGMNEEQQRNQKIQRIDTVKEKAEEEEKMMLEAKTDEIYDKIKEEMMKDLKEQTELEIETGTYDYQKEFNQTLETLKAGLVALDKNVTGESKKWEKKKKRELQKLYNQYSKYNGDEQDYKTLSAQLSDAIHKIVEKYHQK